jgi:hypothetical protein
MTKKCPLHPELRGFTVDSDAIHHVCGCPVLRGETRIELCTRCEQKPGIHPIEDLGVFCDDCVDYCQRVSDEEPEEREE